MFSTGSRYRKVPDVAVPDASGRVLPAKGARPLPEVTGTFTHTVNSGDRLDQLAFTYYRRPLDYWHICDANPSFLSPLALVGAEPVGTTVFPLTAPQHDPPWAMLLAALNGTVGVERVAVEEHVTLLPERQTVNGQQVDVVVERQDRSVAVTHNKIIAGVQAVATVFEDAGFSVGPPAESGQLGQPIIIPAPAQ